jgi:GPI mannosyltransferase 3
VADDTLVVRGTAALPLAAGAMMSVVGLSLSPHKEFRFLLPLIPIASALGSLEAQRWSRPRLLLALLILINGPVACYLSTRHQRGPIDALDHLAGAIGRAGRAAEVYITVRLSLCGSSRGLTGGRVLFQVHFLMPCHATPFYSHLHVPNVDVTLRSLDCSPEGRLSPEGSESDRFQKDPAGFVQGLYGKGVWSWPDYVVMFGSSDVRLTDFWRGHDYHRRTTLFHSDFQGDVDSLEHEASVVVLERSGGSQPEEQAHW